MSIEADPIKTVREVADMLRIKPRTVWRLMAEKKLARIRLSEHRVGVRTSEIDRYLTDLNRAPDAA
jgi:predicted DNA-binding transcriptional regulator AlpA